MKKLSLSHIHGKVAKAIQNGLIPKLNGTIHCMDCQKPATVYDHRDYHKPLEVIPVCRSCNLKRGKGNFREEFSLESGQTIKVSGKTYALLKAQADRLYRSLASHVQALAEAEILRRDWRKSKSHG